MANRPGSESAVAARRAPRGIPESYCKYGAGSPTKRNAADTVLSLPGGDAHELAA